MHKDTMLDNRWRCRQLHLTVSAFQVS
uniref:Uncharacterized protein n=1 Tax=Anguilla anguilla TaxID=7936 RepID=A0A0E9R0J5_ANGAN